MKVVPFVDWTDAQLHDLLATLAGRVKAALPRGGGYALVLFGPHPLKGKHRVFVSAEGTMPEAVCEALEVLRVAVEGE